MGNNRKDVGDTTFRKIKGKEDSPPYRLFVTYDLEGPTYDTVGLDAERDQFEVFFEDGCAVIDTKSLQYVALSPEDLRIVADLTEEAEAHFEEWLEGEMGIEPWYYGSR